MSAPFSEAMAQARAVAVSGSSSKNFERKRFLEGPIRTGYLLSENVEEWRSMSMACIGVVPKPIPGSRIIDSLSTPASRAADTRRVSFSLA